MSDDGYPGLPEVRTYLGQTATTWSDDAVTSALAAETAAQAKVCRVPVVDAEHPLIPDLTESLLRRVARNLALRRLPLGVISDESGSTPLGASDPEIRRLEKPYRGKLPKG